MTVIPFAEWTPDRPELGSSNVALNVVPKPGGYGPFKGPVVGTDALDARAQGSVAIKDTDAVTYIFAGDATKLYFLEASLWSDVSDAGVAPYSTASFNRWEFEQFGQFALALNGTDKLQRYTLGGAATFLEIAATTANQQHLAVVKDFVVMGGDKIRWSARNDVDSWTPTVNSSGEQDLIEGGPLNGITGGDYGTILQEDSITRMTFIGGDAVFQFDPIEQAQGCIAGGSVGKLGQFTYYWSNQGVEVFNGATTQNIGEGRVNQTLLGELDFNRLDRISVAIDPERNLIVWAYPTETSGSASRLLIYNVGENRFSQANFELQILASSRTDTISIDDLGATTIDTVPIFGTATSLDDPQLSNGLLRFGMFDTLNQLNYFTGDNLLGKVATAEFEPNQELRSEIQRVRPLTDDSETTLTVRHRETQQSTIIEDSPLSMRPDGSIPCRVNDRYFSLQSDLESADWTEAEGVRLEEVISRGR